MLPSDNTNSPHRAEPHRSEEESLRIERRIRSILQIFGQITFDLDFVRNVVDWSGGDSLGYDARPTGQTVDDWFDLVHSEDRPKFEAQLAAAQVERKPLYLEVRFRSADGHYRWFQAHGVLHFDERGKATNLIGVLEDMTERLTSANLAAERDSLVRTNSELKEFTYVASHDLQEPLRTITAFVELLNEDHRQCLNEEGREYLDFIGEGAARLQRLINDLLTYSRMTSGQEEISMVSLDQIVQEALGNLYAALDESGARLHIDPMPIVRGEHTRLVLLFQNLIGNAIKFRRAETTPEIHLSVEKTDTHWKITVSDNGIGIPFDQHERVFRIFHRLHSQSAYDGTGMGLAICAKIVERHSGHIWIESAPDEGSSFHFTLKRDSASAS